ncbi:MAG: Mrp/NBP35 family ATP-binding protein [Burkholderiaceae bacterium]
MAKSRARADVALTRDTVLEALRGVHGPDGDDLVASGMMRGLQVGAGNVRFVLHGDPARAAALEKLRDEAERRLRALEGCEDVTIVVTGTNTAGATEARRPSIPIRPASAPPAGPQKVAGIARIVAIASGKGGVGKSTVSANLACALAAQGRRVGLLDADVYGPSQPRMMGVSGRPSSPDGQTILPMRNHGVTLMSIGLMTNDDQAVVWRGPMLMGALQQMMNQVQWGALDVLLVDLPPGTGDVQMTLGQKFTVDGAVIVSTPQDVALLDARKGIDMFRQMKIPILGMIENMSMHVCPKCGHEQHIFGHGGVAAEADKIGVPLLGEIPLHLDIRTAADGGAPVVVSRADSPEAQAFRAIAKRMVAEDMA